MEQTPSITTEEGWTPPAPNIQEAGPPAHLREEDLRRSRFYALLSRLLARPMDADALAFVRSLTGDESDGDESDLGRAVNSLGQLAVRTTQMAAEDEYSVLFYGMGAGGELTPYGSYYLTGFLHEKPLADLRRDLRDLGVERSEDVTEPEDHIAFLCEVMHGLITGAFGEPAGLAGQRAFFDKHIAPWGARCFADIEGAKSAVFYMPVGTVGRLFLAIEADAFRLAAGERTADG